MVSQAVKRIECKRGGYLREHIRKRRSPIPCKRPQLPRRGGDFSDAGANEQDDGDGDHEICPREILRGVVVNLDEGVAGWGCENAGEVTDGEAKS